eukprot:jgi/Tetstr1/442085/TSEL_003168.t1
MGYLSAKKAAKAARNRRGEDLGTEKALSCSGTAAVGRNSSLGRCGWRRPRLEYLTTNGKLPSFRPPGGPAAGLSAHREPLPTAAELAAAFKECKAERLLGAARPWVSQDKSTHGCSYEQDHCGDWENQPPAEDLLAQYHGSLWQNALCRPYCHALLELGAAPLAAGQGEAAAATLTGLMEAEPTDPLGARAYLLSVYMDDGMLGEARALGGGGVTHRLRRPPTRGAVQLGTHQMHCVVGGEDDPELKLLLGEEEALPPLPDSWRTCFNCLSVSIF